MAKSVFQLDEDKQIQKVQAQEANVAAMAALSDAALLNQLWDLTQPISRVADEAAIYKKALEERRYREILDWLSPVPFKLHHKHHSENRLPASGGWLLSHADYLQWKASSTSSILLLHGSAGSGKTALVSVVVDSFINDAAAQASPAPLAYFYCTKTTFESPRSDPDEILRSILRQLSMDPTQRTVHTLVTTEYERREVEAKMDGFSVQRLNASECIRLIVDIATPNPATIIVDAIDEIQAMYRHRLFNAFTAICRESSSVVKIFITSRDDDEQALNLLQGTAKIRIDTYHNREDMEQFVYHRISLAIKSCAMLGGSVTSDLQTDIATALLRSAGERYSSNPPVCVSKLMGCGILDFY